jgi:MFS family permease
VLRVFSSCRRFWIIHRGHNRTLLCWWHIRSLRRHLYCGSLGTKGYNVRWHRCSFAGAALTAGSVHIGMFIAFRFVTGFGGFLLFVAVPLWITEVVPLEVRGAFAKFHGVCTSLGYMISSYVGVGFYVNVSTAGLNTWRGPLAIGALPPILFLCGLWWLPEWPRYLLMKGRTEQAWEIIRKFHTEPGNDDHRYAEIEMFQMKKQIELDRTLPSSWLFMLKTASIRKRMWMTFFIPFATLSSGNLSISTYFVIMLSQTAWSPLHNSTSKLACNWSLCPASSRQFSSRRNFDVPLWLRQAY